MLDYMYEVVQEEFAKFIKEPYVAYDKNLDWKYWSNVADHNYSASQKVKIYSQGMTEGSALCSQFLGIMHFNGDEIKKDEDFATYCFEHSAKRGNATAMTYLSMMYLSRDDDIYFKYGLHWICRAVIEGDGEGYIQLGKWVKKNQDIKDYVECCLQLHYDKICNKNQHTDIEYRFLGWCAWVGVCCKQDFKRAEKYWEEGGKKDLTCKTLFTKMKENNQSDQTSAISSDKTPSSRASVSKENIYTVKQQNDTLKKTVPQSNHTQNNVSKENVMPSNTSQNIQSENKKIEPVKQTNDSKVFSIIAIVLAVLAGNGLIFVLALGCAIWAKKKEEKLANIALIIVAVVFVLTMFFSM